MDADPLSRLDAALGDGLEYAMIGHHRRRLARLGRLDALVPASPGLWSTSGSFGVRQGNSLEVLIDGAQALPAMAEAIRGAQRHVHVCSWHLEAGFEPERHGDRSPLRQLLGEAAEAVRVRLLVWWGAERGPVRLLVWAGAPVPVFKPQRRQLREQRDALMRGTKVRVELDARG